MTQFEFDVIVKLVENGAPALARELCGSLNDLVVEYNQMKQELAMRNNAAAEATKADAE
jgi:hypothetical protein